MADRTANEMLIESRRPPKSKFHQQSMPACQPVWNARTVPRLFLPVGALFICVGAVLVDQSNRVREIQIDYTDCDSNGNPLVYNGSTTVKCAQWLAENPNSNVQCQCSLRFNVTQTIPKPVLIYYGLSNYHQNHRRYVSSRDDKQLYSYEGYGPAEIAKSGSCTGFIPNGNLSGMGYAPCGAVANSLFNDTFRIRLLSTSEANSSESVPLLRTGIAWPSDKIRFRNPTFSNQTWLKPPNWRVPVWELDPSDPMNNGYLNEDLIVWMRSAQLSTFRKPHRRVDHAAPLFADGLPVGSYQLLVDYSYPVKSFDGRKRVFITNTCLTGGKNPTLGIMYIVVGSLAIVFAVLFYVLNARIKPRYAALALHVALIESDTFDSLDTLVAFRNQRASRVVSEKGNRNEPESVPFRSRHESDNRDENDHDQNALCALIQ